MKDSEYVDSNNISYFPNGTPVPDLSTKVAQNSMLNWLSFKCLSPRHSKIEITMEYYLFSSDENKKKVIEKLDGLFA